jgi:hypothetical protein
MISQNCAISPLRDPLFDPTADANAKRDLSSSSTPGTHWHPPNGTRVGPPPAKFTGAIFANGTKLADPPLTLHIGRVQTLKKGTVFSNGTVLGADTPNPAFNEVPPALLNGTSARF